MRIVLAGLLVLVLGGCTAAPAGTAAPGRGSAPTTVSASRQTAAEADATLASLRKVDDLPLYEMSYVGDYDELAGVPMVPTASPFGCSLFVASGGPAPVFGRNFDWDPHAAMVLHTAPPDGYAAVSVVDLSYLGVAKGDDLTTAPKTRRELLNAPLLPFDGLNERGLAVGLAADDSGRAGKNPALPTVGGVRIQRIILDRAATVDQAVELLGRYNLDFTDGPALHYLLADSSGASAVVEFVDGRMEVLRGGPPWQALTNIRLTGADEATRRADRRYETLRARLTRAGGVLTPDAALGLLRDVAQSHTRWSVTYQLDSHDVRVTTAGRWEKVHTFQLRRP
ncbi:carcinine hydrolase/isopenicillin-N N-acyltransferase family protein [Longispora sp. NPDC051575]|uniref:carcinine hydrolase/isopenicillin-N N-acyltransferase family protein n=1 Tax=Longispora sp. NPDC051575 TaxID=3154943 RepID=UPI00342C7DBF